MNKLPRILLIALGIAMVLSGIAKVGGALAEEAAPISIETAIELKALLAERGLACDPETMEGEKYQFYVSDMAEKFTAFATSILPNEVKETRKIHIEEY